MFALLPAPPTHQAIVLRKEMILFNCPFLVVPVCGLIADVETSYELRKLLFFARAAKTSFASHRVSCGTDRREVRML